MTVNHGLCVNAARGAWAPRADQRALGAVWVRSICYEFDQFDAALAEVAPGVRVIALLNSETAGVGKDYEGWPAVVAEFCARFSGRVHALECTNEPDILGLPVEWVAWCVRVAAEAAPPWLRVIAGGVAGPDWAGYLRELRDALGDGTVDGFAIHPYGKRAYTVPAWWHESLGAMLAQAHRIVRAPLYVTEYGIKLEDAGDEATQAFYHTAARALFGATPYVEAACCFGYSDRIANDGLFGLVDGDGTPRLAYHALCLT